jgi:hypothetical protein
VTAYESHLCRSLRKDTAVDRYESVAKYSSLFAHVKETSILKQLLSASNDVKAKPPTAVKQEQPPPAKVVAPPAKVSKKK